MFTRFFFRLQTALLLSLSLITMKAAKADTYTFTYVGVDNRQFAAGDDYGDFAIRLNNTDPCGAAANQCFATWSAYEQKYIAYTTWLPELLADPNVQAGPGCTMSASSFYSVFRNLCNNGYQIIDGFLDSNHYGIYTGSGTDIRLFHSGALAGISILTANGNFFFDDGVRDDLWAAVNTTTAPAPVPFAVSTPEPSSLALLGTGVLGIVGLARRRLLA